MPPPVNPWFKFFPRDFLLSQKVQAMTKEEIGWYLTFLCHQWLEGSLPKELPDIQSLFKVPSKDFQSVSNVVSMCFPLHGKCRMNPKLKRIKREQEQYYQAHREAGQKGGLTAATLKQRLSTAPATLNQSNPNPTLNKTKQTLTPIQSKLTLDDVRAEEERLRAYDERAQTHRKTSEVSPSSRSGEFPKDVGFKIPPHLRH